MMKKTTLLNKSILASNATEDKSKSPITNEIVVKKQRNIFIQNMNNKYKLVPFNIRENNVGETRYSPPASKE